MHPLTSGHSHCFIQHNSPWNLLVNVIPEQWVEWERCTQEVPAILVALYSAPPAGPNNAITQSERITLVLKAFVGHDGIWAAPPVVANPCPYWPRYFFASRITPQESTALMEWHIIPSLSTPLIVEKFGLWDRSHICIVGIYGWVAKNIEEVHTGIQCIYTEALLDSISDIALHPGDTLKTVIIHATKADTHYRHLDTQVISLIFRTSICVHLLTIVHPD